MEVTVALFPSHHRWKCENSAIRYTIFEMDGNGCRMLLDIYEMEERHIKSSIRWRQRYKRLEDSNLRYITTVQFREGLKLLKTQLDK